MCTVTGLMMPVAHLKRFGVESCYGAAFEIFPVNVDEDTGRDQQIGEGKKTADQVYFTDFVVQ